LLPAVEEALRLGVSDTAAVRHIRDMPRTEDRRQYAAALAESFELCER
jgi:hypothetical protein